MKKEGLSEKELDDILNHLTKSAYSPKGKYSSNESYTKLEAEFFPNKKKSLSLFKYIAAASVAIILILSTYTLYVTNTPEIIVVTTRNNIEELILPDGSHVTLGRYSSLHYPSKFDKKDREVILTGEAYLDVAKNKDHPFIVHADDICVEVLGTQFNIQSYPNNPYIKTTLIEGKVAVSSVKNNKTVILHPNETAFFNKESETIYKQIDIEAKTDIAWREGKHVFNNRTLQEIAQDLSNYFNVKISIDSDTLKTYSLTAHFEQNETIEDILNILQTAVNFKWEEENGMIIITQ